MNEQVDGRGSVEARDIGALATVLGEPNHYGSVYVAHANIRELLAERILASSWLVAHDEQVRAAERARLHFRGLTEEEMNEQGGRTP